MKLQFKLTVYNTVTKLAIILCTAVVILFSLEKISYHHISLRLEDKKNEFLRHLSSTTVKDLLQQQDTFIDYNILKDDYIILKEVKYEPINTVIDTFSTAQRTIDRTTETYRILSCKFNYNKKTYFLEVGNTIDAVEQVKETIKSYTLFILIAALTLTLFIDLIFTKYLLNPLYKIIDTKLIRVNDPLNYDYQKISTSTQDFNLLDDSINTLMRKISQMFLLEKQFIANVSHELLTPISIITSRLENILAYETLSEDAENKIFGSLKTLNRLKSIINSLLLISQVENNQFNKADQVNLSEVLHEIQEELEDRIEDKGIKLNQKLKHHITITANRALIHTMLYNVINNAIKYNRLNGHIDITDSLDGSDYVLEITDTGVGMANEQIQRAFERFEKLDTDERESFGLGLAIVKSIAAFHNIAIGITSIKDAGTTISLKFNQLSTSHNLHK
ncbi:HAMP domain-containing histidine kinase [Mucilaginibacter sp. RS28]|uniref:histidine kinase n=1 Tax=Mucilaginibacter straminoryzae TaxID=2932774 RepID=A0A9X1X379_9SPHI|nr:HAMP domain-containing sensor histidine kinase [Mucilaginibacter straminoryzae]MCJ8210188.1 HAMP domain-containing histidine kinase [Mucilaginibacter straminoryzae]